MGFETIACKPSWSNQMSELGVPMRDQAEIFNLAVRKVFLGVCYIRT